MTRFLGQFSSLPEMLGSQNHTCCGFEVPKSTRIDDMGACHFEAGVVVRHFKFGVLVRCCGLAVVALLGRSGMFLSSLAGQPQVLQRLNSRSCLFTTELPKPGPERGVFVPAHRKLRNISRVL